MRSHRNWPLLQLWSRKRNLKAWIKPENLRVARLEPAIVRGNPTAVLDLRFVHNDIGVCVPCCLIDRQELVLRLKDSLIWPAAITNIAKDDDLYALESMLVPWLLAESAGQGFVAERVRRFGPGEQAFEAARHAQLLGAVSYQSLGIQLAAAHYAARFVTGQSLVSVRSLSNVAALLAPSAVQTSLVGCDAGDQALLNTWFGSTMLPISPASATVAVLAGDEDTEFRAGLNPTARIIDVSGSLPGAAITVAPGAVLDELVRLGETSARVFTTQVALESPTSRSLVPVAPLSTGGSSGRILLALREDAWRASGADTDEAWALRQLLVAEGFTVDVTVRPDEEDPAGYDLVHGFSLLAAPGLLACAERAAQAGVPFVLTPYFEDVADAGWWGARAARSLLDIVHDEESAQRVFELLAARLVYVDQINAQERWDNGDEAARHELLRRADLVIAHSESEQDAIRKYAQRQEAIALSLPLVYRATESLSVAHLVPDQPYLFVQAGIEARHNIGLVMSAASALDLPCVFAGEILDRRLYRHLTSRTGTNLVMLPQCTDGEIAAVAQGAAVFVDAAWIGDGTSRILRSLLHGVVPVVSERRPLDEALEPFVIRVDPASLQSLRNGMSDAWQRTGKHYAQTASTSIASFYNPGAVFQAIISAYATANEQRKSLANL